MSEPHDGTAAGGDRAEMAGAGEVARGEPGGAGAAGVGDSAPGGARAANGGGGRVRIALLWLAAALISGFTARRYLGPLDEGVLMQAAARMADGQWPWRDFGWSYGPGQPLAVLGLGDSLLSWRVLRVAADATVTVLIWALVRDVRPRWALPAWLAAAVTVAQPTSANPTAPALAFSLGAVYLATRGRPAWAGALAALAAFWRPDVGAIAALAAAAVLVLGERGEGTARRRGAGVAGERRADGAAGTGGERWRGAADERPSDGSTRTGGERWRGAADERPSDGAAGTGGERWRGAADARPSDGAARRGGERWRGAVVVLASAAVVGLALYAPFLVAAGPGRVWDALVVQATRDGEYWRLPFPDGFPGGDAKDFLAWLAPYGALVVLVVAAVQRRGVGLVVLGAGAAIYFLSRADLEHAQGLLVLAAGLAAVIRPRALGAALLAILILVGVGNRASALLRPPELTAFQHVRVPPAEAEALTKTVALVQRLVPPGEPIYVAPRRSDLVSFSNPLLHRLVDRPNVLRRDVLLQAKPDEQRAIVAKLRATRPRVIIRWTDPASAAPEPNRRGRPSGSRALDDYIDGAYVLRARHGYYDVLLSRSIASR